MRHTLSLAVYLLLNTLLGMNVVYLGFKRVQRGRRLAFIFTGASVVVVGVLVTLNLVLRP